MKRGSNQYCKSREKRTCRVITSLADWLRVGVFAAAEPNTKLNHRSIEMYRIKSTRTATHSKTEQKPLTHSTVRRSRSNVKRNDLIWIFNFAVWTNILLFIFRFFFSTSISCAYFICERFFRLSVVRCNTALSTIASHSPRHNQQNEKKKKTRKTESL